MYVHVAELSFEMISSRCIAMQRAHPKPINAPRVSHDGCVGFVPDIQEFYLTYTRPMSYVYQRQVSDEERSLPLIIYILRAYS